MVSITTAEPITSWCCNLEQSIVDGSNCRVVRVSSIRAGRKGTLTVKLTGINMERCNVALLHQQTLLNRVLDVSGIKKEGK